MTSEIIGVIVGAAIALLVARTTRKSEERRWYLDTLLKAKIESLQILYSTLNDCFFALSNGLNYPPLTIEKYNTDVLPALLAFNRADQIASIYLDQKSEHLLRQMGAQVGLARDNISKKLVAQLNGQTNFSDWPQFDWTGFNGTFDEMRSCLRQVLNPSLLMEFEKLE